ncbi:hypothetical protein F8M41_003857 [Gigaspora margarita]|uniref:Uncharacterized protein n=1 Tax=Gigaspora margarita TaxID=4874 RepID=A0A8H3XAL0_GIGMA|nr:hypothetical protein F8M41_003857 [Gigaspora margarita]
MPPLGINSIIIGMATQTAKNVKNDLALDFYVEERIEEKEPPSFWVQAKHNASNRYLFTKTKAINQTSKSTTTLLISTITYQHDNETASEKHIMILEDISMINLTHNNSNALSATLPWLSQSTISEYQQGKTSRTPQGATPRTSKNKCTTFSI